VRNRGYFRVTDNVVLSSIFLFARWRYPVVVATINYFSAVAFPLVSAGAELLVVIAIFVCWLINGVEQG
jgi:hypothetical protein